MVFFLLEVNNLLLAKSDPPQSLLHHSIEVFKIIHQYAKRWSHLAQISDALELFEDAELAGLFHDLGKSAAGFQSILLGEKTKKDYTWNHYRHEILSGALVATINDSHRRADLLLAILTHHIGMNKDSLTGPSLYKFSPQVNTTLPFKERLKQLEPFWEQLKELLNQLKTHVPNVEVTFWLDLPSSPLSLPDPFDILKRDNDILKQRSRKPNNLAQKNFLKRVYLRGLLTSADHLASAAAFEHSSDTKEVISPLPHPKKIKPENFKFHLYQHQLNAAIDGSVMFSAPTGSGKTEAALLWSEANQNKIRSRHIFYVLPYTASINAMYHRLCSHFGQGAVSLLHGRSSYFLYRWLCEAGNESFKAMAKARKLRQQTKELYYPIKVLTPHQILMSFLGLKGWEKAWTEYSGGLFILDEIHAYEPKLAGLFFEILRRLTQQLGAKIFVMSATFPTILREKMREYLPKDTHLIDLDPKERECYTRHRIQVKNGNISDYIPDILERLKKGERVLVVLNTVQGAMEAFQQLSPHAKNPCLIHGRLILKDRQEVEKGLRKSIKKPVVDLLIGTQAIEVSLDVDFDVLFTDPAPLDALLQRLGRVNRKPLQQLISLHSKERFKDVIVCKKQWPKTYSVYGHNAMGHTLVQKSLAILAQDHLLHEGKIQKTIDEVYNSEQIKPFIKIAEEKAHRLSELIDTLEPGSESERDEATLLDKMIDSIPIVPIQFKEAYDALIEEKRFFDAQDYTMNISKGRYIVLKNNDQISSFRGNHYGLFAYMPKIGPIFDKILTPKVGIF